MHGSAEQAWWGLALRLESCAAVGKPVSVAAVDIFKCFDQISRELLTCMLAAAGLPKRVLQAYADMIFRLGIVNVLCVGLGEHHQREVGIPQGCPLSMTWLALLMRPWILMMRELGVTPRTLADDLLLLADGDGHEERLCKAVDATFRYIADLGGRVSAAKCYLSSSCAGTRGRLRTRTWGEAEARKGARDRHTRHGDMG